MGGLALVLCSSLAAPSSAAVKPIHARHLIVQTRAGKRVPARPVLLRIRAHRRARVGVRLNGKPIGRFFSRPSRRGLRRLRASPTHGLRHGRNVLWVRVRYRKRAARVQTVRFRVAKNRPLAAAGRDRRVAQHARFNLEGRRSRPRPASRGRPLRYRWRLVRAPRASKLWRLTQGRKRRGRRRVAPRVRNLGPRAKAPRPHAVRPAVRLEHPGVYRFKLTVIDPDGRRGSDRVSLRVDPPPLVSIDTMAKPKKSKFWGVRVGTQFYSDPGKNRQWLQVVALKSATQELIWKRSYSCPQATANPHADSAALAAVKKCTKKVRGDINGLSGRNAIVIAVSQRVGGKMERSKPWQTQPPVGFWTAIEGAGGATADLDYAHPKTPLLRGRVSAVWRTRASAKTIPWRIPLVAHNPHDLDRLDSGEATGFLVRDSAGRYSSFRDSGYIPYETQAAGSKPLANVIRVGSSRYPSETNDGSTTFRSGEGGFQVVMVDPNSLQGVSGTFGTRLKGCGGQCAVSVGEMKDWIQSHASRHSLLLLASVGDSRLDPSNIGEAQRKVTENSAANALVSLLAGQFGATRNRVYRMLHDTGSTPDGPRSYTLVANQGTGSGHGLEREGPPGKAGANGVPQSGSLTRNNIYEYVPQAGLVSGRLGDAGAKLREIAFSQTSSWPEQGNRGRGAAIGWVGSQVGIDSRRSLYWTQPYTFEFWSRKAKEIAELTKPKILGFNQADFSWAKGELIREIGWLESVHSFASNLAQPFKKGQDWTDVEKVAARIKNEVISSSEAEKVVQTEQEALVVLDFAREIADALPLVGNVVRAVQATYYAVAGLVELNAGKDATEPFNVTAGELGNEVKRRLILIQDAIEDQLVDIVVADYDKLRTVGLCGELSRACPDKPLEQWQFTKTEQSAAAPKILSGFETLFYMGLMPTAYDAWLLPKSSYTATSHDQGHQVAGETAGGFWCAFYQLPLSAQVAVPIKLNVEGVPGLPDTWQVAAYGRRKNKKNGAWRMIMPNAKVTDPLFRPIGEGGLGANPEAFYLRSWAGGAAPKPLVEFPEKWAKVLWIEHYKTFGIKNECGWD